jgi:hypothetical protein
MTDTVVTQRKLGTRAVIRRVDPGSSTTCSSCNEYVRFAARENRQQVIANVYEHDRWNRVEHFHRDCYELTGSPYGVATE